MKVGRNDPCPCGSGKKYKKCCLPNNDASAREQYARNAAIHRAAAETLWPSPLPAAPFPEPAPFLEPELPPRDPRDDDRDKLWKEFEDAEPHDHLGIFQRALADGDLLDSELAFEMLCMIRDHSGRESYARATDMLRAQRPDLYENDVLYYIDWQIGDALVTGNLARLPEFATLAAAQAGNDLDLFYSVLDRLTYHGQLQLVAPMLAQAWPHVEDSEKLVEWAPAEFARRASNLTLFAYFERNPEIQPTDPELLAALEHFLSIDPARVAEYLALLSGRAERQWSIGDFALQRRGRNQREVEDDATPPDPAAQQLADLTLAFLGVLHREGVSLAKGEIARRSIMGYLFDRHTGRLLPPDVSLLPQRRPKQHKAPQAKSHAPANVLCPDRNTLDRFLAGALNTITARYYEAAATLEFVPAWLRFLEEHGLLTPQQRADAFNDLHKLVSEAAPIWEQRGDDPTMGVNIRLAWEHI